MLEVLCKFLCFIIMAITGFYTIKEITKSKETLLNIRSVGYLIVLVMIQMCLYKVQYTITYTLTVFLLNIIVYKEIFKLRLENSIISCSVFTIILFLSDIIISTVVGPFIPPDAARSASMVSIQMNALIGLLTYIIATLKPIKLKIQKFYENVKNNRRTTNIIFFILIIVDFSYIAYNLLNNRKYDLEFIGNLTAMIIFVVVVFIYIENKNSYHQLSDEYDTLFTYVQNFEDWIEKEQLNRHEYKNQLAVLRSITKDKNVKKKIDDILEDNINIESDVVHKLKELPKGGLKGLMYYKVAIAQKNNLKIEVDVSLNHKTLLSSLTEIQIKTLCKLIGIYFDNAIEASVETKKKSILLEIYELSDKVNIVISNSYKKAKNFDKRNERGITTKGEGHGNGLYFAKNLTLRNQWLESKQEEIDDYYIQTITIKKLD